MPPIVAPEERARAVQASPAEIRSPRGFVAAVPTSPTPFTPLSPPALQPPPPSHYLRNRNRNSEGSDLIRKRSEIYTRVQRVLPPATFAEESASGLLFGSDFHADWANIRLGRPPLSSPRHVVATPIHAPNTPPVQSSREPNSKPSLSAHSTTDSMSSLQDEDTQEVSPSVQLSEASKARPSRRPFRTLLRERLTLNVRSRSVEAASATQPVSSTDELPRHSTESSPLFNQHFGWPPSPGSSASSTAYEGSFWGSEVDVNKKSISSSASLKGPPPTPPSPTHINLRTPPSTSVSLLEAQKVRRAKAFDQFTRYSETTPFQRSPNTLAAPVPPTAHGLVLHSAREVPTEAPVQWTPATEVHRVSSAPDLQQQFQRQSQSVPPYTPPSHATPHATPHTPATTTLIPLATLATTTSAPEGKPHRTSGHRKSTGVSIPSVGSLKAILRPRSHSKATAIYPH